MFQDAYTAKQRLEIDRIDVINNAIETVTVNGYPFSLMSSSGYSKAIYPRILALRQKGLKISIDRNSIVKHVNKKSKLIRHQLTEELRDRHVSLMLDIATKSRLSVLGISAQFIKNDAVVCRSLGVIELQAKHTGKNIAKVLIKLLQQFGIDLEQVYSITVDNARNLAKMLEILNELGISPEEIDEFIRENEDEDGVLPQQQQEQQQAESNDITISESDVESDEEDNESDEIDAVGNPYDLDDEEEIENIADGTDRCRELMNEVVEEFVRINGDIISMHPVKCAAHTLQLALAAGLNASNVDPIIDKVRKMSKKMRTSCIDRILKKHYPGSTLPPLDVETRWNSTFKMVRKLNFLPVLIFLERLFTLYISLFIFFISMAVAWLQ